MKVGIVLAGVCAGARFGSVVSFCSSAGHFGKTGYSQPPSMFAGKEQ